MAVTSDKLMYRGTGRRKTAVAQVRLLAGTGNITINGLTHEAYVGGRVALQRLIRQPLLATGTQNKYDVAIKVTGGGIASQIGACRHGVARALLDIDEAFHDALKSEGYLTRDPRMKERKKYGRKRARKRFQFSKR